MPKVIAIANQKGGVGKTTSTYNLSAAIAKSGYKVCMIDLDPQSSLTSDCGFYVDMEIYKGSCAEQLFKPDTDPDDCCFTVDSVGSLSTNLFLIPSGQDMAIWEVEIYSHKESIPGFAKKVRSLEYFDYIFIDCPPNLGYLLLSALYAADEVLIPVETTYSSYSKLPLLMSTINQMKAYGANAKGQLTNPDLQIAGVIGTRYRSTVEEQRKVLAELEENYNLLGYVKEAAIVTKNVVSGLPVVVASKNSVPARQYTDIAMALLEDR